MASWNSLKQYITSNYKVTRDDGDVLSMVFEAGGGRSQVVFVRRMTAADIEWAEIGTPVAEVAQVDPRDCMIRNGKMVIGGLGFEGDIVIFRHSFPLADLDTAEFEIPLRVVVGFGDRLEMELTQGGDRF